MTAPLGPVQRDARRRRRIAAAHRVVAGLAALLAVAGAFLVATAPVALAEHGTRHPVAAGRQQVADWGRPAAPARTTVSYADARTAWTDCAAVLWVTFDAKDIVGGRQVLVHDDAHVTVLLHDYSGRLQWPGHDGSWLTTADYGVLDQAGRPVDFVSGGESRVRWVGYRDATTTGGAHIDKVEVRRGGITSTPVPIEDGCTS